MACPQDLIDAINAVFAECIGVDGMVPMHEYDDEARRIITVVRTYDATHPAPDVSDEALGKVVYESLGPAVWSDDNEPETIIDAMGLDPADSDLENKVDDYYGENIPWDVWIRNNMAMIWEDHPTAEGMVRAGMAVRQALASSGAAVDVPLERIDWQGVLTDALCAYDDWEKAEQGFGQLDSGWTNPGSDHIAWWINAYGVPALSAAIADAVGKEGEG